MILAILTMLIMMACGVSNEWVGRVTLFLLALAVAITSLTGSKR